MRRLIIALSLFWVACGDSDGHPIQLDADMLTGHGVFSLWRLDGEPQQLALLEAGTDSVRSSMIPEDGARIGIRAGEAGPVLLAGKVKDGKATLRVDDELALGEDFEDASAQYTLATPTNGPDSDEHSGIWYLGIYAGDTEPSQALFLPELPEAWVYEAWVELDGVQISTGRFSDPDGPDDDASHSGPEHAPPFPGEDLLENPPSKLDFPTDLEGARAFITVEPNEADAAAPFLLRVFDGEIESMVDMDDLTLLDNVAADLPKLTVSF